MDTCLSDADMNHEHEMWLHDLWSHEDTIREAQRESAQCEGNE